MRCGACHKDGVLIEALWPNFNPEVNIWLLVSWVEGYSVLGLEHGVELRNRRF